MIELVKIRSTALIHHTKYAVGIVLSKEITKKEFREFRQLLPSSYSSKYIGPTYRVLIGNRICGFFQIYDENSSEHYKNSYILFEYPLFLLDQITMNSVEFINDKSIEI